MYTNQKYTGSYRAHSEMTRHMILNTVNRLLTFAVGQQTLRLRDVMTYFAVGQQTLRLGDVMTQLLFGGVLKDVHEA